MKLETLRRGAASIFFGLVGIGALGTGCGKSDTPPTIASFCEQKAEKECGTKDKGVAHDCGASVTACTALRLTACTTLATQQSVAHPLRADAIANCLSKTDAAYSQPPTTPARACFRAWARRGRRARASWIVMSGLFATAPSARRPRRWRRTRCVT